MAPGTDLMKDPIVYSVSRIVLSDKSTQHVFIVRQQKLDKATTNVNTTQSSALPRCLQEKSSALTRAPSGLLGAYVPQCTEGGEYEALQLHGSTGEHWCVFTNGTEINGTRGRGEQPNCLDG